MIHTWTDISYLNRGTDRQRDAYLVLLELDVFGVLVEFDPVLVGTIPLDVDTESSDLDILCYVTDFDLLEQNLRNVYTIYDQFEVVRKVVDGLPTMISRFSYHGFALEIFGQPLPTEEQRAYAHFVAEARLLAMAGDEAKVAIRAMKDARRED